MLAATVMAAPTWGLRTELPPDHGGNDRMLYVRRALFRLFVEKNSGWCLLPWAGGAFDEGLAAGHVRRV